MFGKVQKKSFIIPFCHAPLWKEKRIITICFKTRMWPFSLHGTDRCIKKIAEVASSSGRHFQAMVGFMVQNPGIGISTRRVGKQTEGYCVTRFT
jgi:hypothetical protein